MEWEANAIRPLRSREEATEEGGRSRRPIFIRQSINNLNNLINFIPLDLI